MGRNRSRKGDWVQVERTILEAGSRAPGIPGDTADLPMLARVKGFALDSASVGEDLEIETAIGRRIRGRLVEVDPTYGHDFGGPIPELTRAGLDARAALEGRGKR